MDKYDEAVKFLTENPEQITLAWHNINPQNVAHCLFQFCGPVGQCGCLTQVRSHTLPAATPKLTRLIRKDKRIPDSAEAITLESLPVFAEWQRQLDTLLNRV